MQVISGEPDVMAIVSHRRNEKGYRNLQGDRMRSQLINFISTQVSGHSIMLIVSLISLGQFYCCVDDVVY